MKKKHDFICVSVAMIILATLLTACDLSKIRVGEVRMMSGTNEDGRIAYNFSIFTGIESGRINVEIGQTISFDYQVTVNKGSLVIEWQDPNGEVVWRKIFVESDHGNGEIAIESQGTYTILIQGKKAAGDFDISWKIE